MSKTTFCAWVLVTLAFVGMIDAAYVGMNSSRGFVVPCAINGGCDDVLNSPYSRIFGLPVAWLGFSFYLICAGVGAFAVFGFLRLLRLTLAVSISAFAFTLYLLYLQAFVLQAFCDYCLLSALLVTLILSTHLYLRPWRLA